MKEYLVEGRNVRFYSHMPTMRDVEMISRAITSESLGIDSENLLCSKSKIDDGFKLKS